MQQSIDYAYDDTSVIAALKQWTIHQAKHAEYNKQAFLGRDVPSYIL